VKRLWPPPPWLALIAGAALFAVGLALGGDEWMIRAQPSAARILDWSLGVSKGLYFVAALSVVVIARLWPRARDPVHLALGLAWFVAVCGAQYAAGLMAVALAVHWLGHRLHPHVAMACVAAALLAGARFVFGELPPGAKMSLGLAGLRMIYYAFELRAVRRSRRDVVSMLAYAPFSLLLWPGPTQLSYLTYTSTRPRAELDALGARQSLRGAAKLIACALLLRYVHERLPDIRAFESLTFSKQALLVLLPYPLFFLQLSIRQDVAAALCNFAGHYAPNSFRWPFLATNPFDFWRRWNVHVLDFFRRAFIYEAARRVRSVVVMIFAGMIGSVLYHAFKSSFIAGRDMNLGPVVWIAGSYLGLAAGILVITIPLDKYHDRLSLPWTIAFGVLSQLSFAVITFIFMPEIFFGPLPRPAACLVASMLGYHGRCGF
jgi:hypothetical protein